MRAQIGIAVSPERRIASDNDVCAARRARGGMRLSAGRLWERGESCKGNEVEMRRRVQHTKARSRTLSRTIRLPCSFMPVAVGVGARQGDRAVTSVLAVVASPVSTEPSGAGGPAARVSQRGHLRCVGGRLLSDLRRSSACSVSIDWLLITSVHKQESSFSTAPSTYEGLNFAGCCGGPLQFNVNNGPVSTCATHTCIANAPPRMTTAPLSTRRFMTTSTRSWRQHGYSPQTARASRW